jgi:hypothetical protein
MRSLILMVAVLMLLFPGCDPKETSDAAPTPSTANSSPASAKETAKASDTAAQAEGSKGGTGATEGNPVDNLEEFQVTPSGSSASSGNVKP